VNIHIIEGDLESAYHASIGIPEFEPPYKMEEYSKRLNSVPHLILTAVLEENPVGFMIGYNRFSDGSFYNWIGGVLCIYRQKGLASKLVDYQEDWAKTNGFHSIKLKTRRKHEAMISFSLNRGYSIIDAESKPDLRETRLWMEKQL